jgi:hypothetical protein
LFQTSEIRTFSPATHLAAPAVNPGTGARLQNSNTAKSSHGGIALELHRMAAQDDVKKFTKCTEFDLKKILRWLTFPPI